MKIQPLNININNKNIVKYNESSQTYNCLNSNYNSTQLTYNPKNYISFAGYSTNLKQSIEELSQAEALSDKKHLPNRVKTFAQEQIKSGNTDELTLIDIHKQAYADIMLAQSIDEVRDKFPEFKDIKSVYEIGYTAPKGSFIREVVDGKNKYFDNNEDLSLQLLKLYWGEGYSLASLADFTKIEEGKLYSAMRILNIPRVTSLYGNVLKRSDKEYSARLAESFALKYAQRFEQIYGHIHIPNGPLTKEHRQKISQSLINYYIENPDRAYLQTNRVKDFYSKNIHASEIFTTVLKDAWNLSSSNQVKKELHDFFVAKSGKSISNEQLIYCTDLKSSQKLLMQEFWQTHPKAKKDFSRSMKSAWMHINKRLDAEKNAEFSNIALFPRQIEKDAKRYFEITGRSLDDCILQMVSLNGGTSYVSPITGSKTLYNFLMVNPQVDKILATALVSTFVHTKNLISNSKDSIAKELKTELKSIETQIAKEGITTNFALNYYFSMCRRLAKNNKFELLHKIKTFYEMHSYGVATNALKGEVLDCEVITRK